MPPPVGPRISTYPQNPSDLPNEIYEKAYSEEDPPIHYPSEGLGDIAANHVPLRKNSNLIAKEERAVAAKSTPTLDLTGAQSTVSFQQQMPAMVANIASQVAMDVLKGLGLGGGTPIGSWKPARNFAALADGGRGEDGGRDGANADVGGAGIGGAKGAALANAAPANGDAAVDAPGAAAVVPPKHTLGVLDYEKDALREMAEKAAKAAKTAKAAKAVKATATPAGSHKPGTGGGKGRGRGRGRGRGDAAKPAFPPKPIALKVDLKDVLIKKEAKSCTRNTFCCRAYSVAERTCKAKGETAAVLDATRKWAYAQAAEFYDKCKGK